MTFAYSGGPIQCLPPGPPDCDPPGPCSPCGVGPGTVSVPLDVTFVTGDGAFNEHLNATATETSQPGSMVDWQASIPARQLHGTYPPMFSPNETVIFEGQLDSTSYNAGIVDEMVPNLISGGGGSWGE